MIKIIPSHQINASVWNNLVLSHKAPIYNQYQYLSSLAKHWAAVVVNNYEAALPFCYNKKWGITYVYMPCFVQQLTVMGNTQHTSLMLQALQAFAKHINLFISSNSFLKGNELEEKNNYVLSLNTSYHNLFHQFKKNLQYDIKKAAKQVIVIDNVCIEEAVNFYHQLNAHKMGKAFNKEALLQFILLAKQYATQNNCMVKQAVLPNGEIVAQALYLKDEHRIYNLVAASNHQGRQNKAMHVILNSVIKQYANTNYVLDFEGSSVAGIAHFYKSFAASNNPYAVYKSNTLPLLIRALVR